MKSCWFSAASPTGRKSKVFDAEGNELVYVAAYDPISRTAIMYVPKEAAEHPNENFYIRRGNKNLPIDVAVDGSGRLKTIQKVLPGSYIVVGGVKY